MPAREPGADRKVDRIEDQERDDQRRAANLERKHQDGRRNDEYGNRRVTAPLVCRCGADHLFAQPYRKHQAEQRRIVGVPAVDREKVLGSDRKKGRNQRQPQAMRIVDQDGQRQPGYCRAQREQPLSPEQPVQHHVERTGGRNDEQDLQRAAVEAKNRDTEHEVGREKGQHPEARIRCCGKSEKFLCSRIAHTVAMST